MPRILALGAALLLACSGGGDDTGDTATDTGDTSADTSLVVTLVDGEGTPWVGYEVAFHAPDGSILGTVSSDTQGEASWDGFPTGGAVTVAFDVGGSHRIRTLTDLRPGDDPTFLQDPFLDPAEVDVTVDAYQGSVDHYAIRGPCLAEPTLGDASESVTLPFAEDCIDDQRRVDLIAYAMDAGGQPLAVATADVPVPAPGGSGSATVSGWGTALSTVSVSVSSAPDQTTEVTAEVDHLRDGLDAGGLHRSTALSAGGSHTFQLPGVIDGYGTYVIETAVDFGSSDISFSGRKRHLAAPPAGESVDLQADLLPRVYDLGVDLSDTARPEMDWKLAGTPDQADRLSLSLSWETGGEDYSWLLVLPPDTTPPAQYPVLPSHLQAPGTASAYGTGSIAYVGSDAADGYAEAITSYPNPDRFELVDASPPGTAWRSLALRYDVAP